MSLSRISAEIPQETEVVVIQHIKDARAQLPFLVDLSAEERKRIPKLGRTRVDFVDRGLIHLTAHPELKPPIIDIAEFTSDVELKNALRRVEKELDDLRDRVRDTLMVVESEAYQATRVFYKTVKSAAKEGVEDAERIVKDLAYHYKGQGRVKK
ncbi:MAG: hypothetical protein GY950_13940, partial [bacterium]|nr:hypothetical protein [bacterium]